MKRAPHTSTTPGKRVRVTLRDGSPAIEGRFVASRSRAVVVEVSAVAGVVFAELTIPKAHIKQFIVNPRRTA
jgi:hypothetical protein